MYITGLIDYFSFNKMNGKFECFAGKYLMGSAENHIDLAQLMVEHGLAKTTSCNFNDWKPAVEIFDNALDVYNWKVNKVA